MSPKTITTNLVLLLRALILTLHFWVRRFRVTPFAPRLLVVRKLKVIVNTRLNGRLTKASWARPNTYDLVQARLVFRLVVVFLLGPPWPSSTVDAGTAIQWEVLPVQCIRSGYGAQVFLLAGR
ncbi:hypothetical protein Z517_09385 [Fonsecaea pedrosoi CBS 271.37]|uniref:Uncharacterized protein n=1 Tax=Fonsecaea pedrosoi CBS 271.37 TaxID=1442368 RepID=A0A0D2DGZ1_9EURO|nr:uncharacterized protein Z517_09385 [Fonsecaea pedrosoi CBS 271.37]KIW76941.1 hypothetical protein Z517_09385 [Fonsecaea pedrosoi CBS 271.37]